MTSQQENIPNDPPTTYGEFNIFDLLDEASIGPDSSPAPMQTRAPFKGQQDVSQNGVNRTNSTPYAGSNREVADGMGYAVSDPRQALDVDVQEYAYTPKPPTYPPPHQQVGQSSSELADDGALAYMHRIPRSRTSPSNSFLAWSASRANASWSSSNNQQRQPQLLVHGHPSSFSRDTPVQMHSGNEIARSAQYAGSSVSLPGANQQQSQIYSYGATSFAQQRIPRPLMQTTATNSGLVGGAGAANDVTPERPETQTSFKQTNFASVPLSSSPATIAHKSTAEPNTATNRPSALSEAPSDAPSEDYVVSISSSASESLIADLPLSFKSASEAREFLDRRKKFEFKNDDVEQVEANQEYWVRRIMRACMKGSYLDASTQTKSKRSLNEDEAAEWYRWQKEHAKPVSDALGMAGIDDVVESKAWLILDEILSTHKFGFAFSSFKADTSLRCSKRLEEAIAMIEGYGILRYDILAERKFKDKDFAKSPVKYVQGKFQNLWVNYGKAVRNGNRNKGKEASDKATTDTASGQQSSDKTRKTPANVLSSFFSKEEIKEFMKELTRTKISGTQVDASGGEDSTNNDVDDEEAEGLEETDAVEEASSFLDDNLYDSGVGQVSTTAGRSMPSGRAPTAVSTPLAQPPTTPDSSTAFVVQPSRLKRRRMLSRDSEP